MPCDNVHEVSIEVYHTALTASRSSPPALAAGGGRVEMNAKCPTVPSAWEGGLLPATGAGC